MSISITNQKIFDSKLHSLKNSIMKTIQRKICPSSAFESISCVMPELRFSSNRLLLLKYIITLKNIHIMLEYFPE